MGDKTSIEWAANADGSPGATWNPIRARDPQTGQVGWHCVHASEGCRNCYAERMNNRLGTQHAFKPTAPVEVYLDEQTLLQPIRWKRGRVIFVCSMTDLFADFVDDDWIERVFAVMALAPQHTFIVLTKRSWRMVRFFRGIAEPGGEGMRDAVIEGQAHKIHHAQTGQDPSMWLAVHMPLPNVWLGVSAEDQRTYDQRRNDLKNTPAAVRFFSYEPLLGPIVPDFLADWGIVGGESGAGARPMHPEWARGLRDQYVAAGVPYFFKQWGEFVPIGAHYPGVASGAVWIDGVHCLAPDRLVKIDDENFAARIGRQRAGRLLYGREWNERPPL